MNDKRIILHVDLNSFFAKAEQQANPLIRNKPVGVVKGKGRTCIIAASPEAKRLGIGTGSRSYDAKKIYPEIILVPADFSKYEDISRRFIKICSSYSPLCEVFSLDECFLDVTETEQFWPRPPRNASLEHVAWFELGQKLRGSAGGGNAFNIAFDIKKRIREEIGDYLTVSIGVSYNRLLAKLAGEQIKPDGLFWITEDNTYEILDRSDLMDVCGIGWGLYSHLTKLQISDFKTLRACSQRFLHDNFGTYWGPYLYNICRGIDTTPVNSFMILPEQKSVGRTYTTHRLLTIKSEIFKVVRNLCEEAAYKARRMGLAGRYVGFSLREGHGGKSFWGHRTLKIATDNGGKMFELCKTIAKDWNVREVIFCGVTLGMLTKNSYLTTPLFADERKRRTLIKSVDFVNDKYGDYTVFPGQLLGMPLVMPEVTGYFGDRKYQLKKLGF